MKDTDPGLVHLYWGKGKGKTTAAIRQLQLWDLRSVPSGMAGVSQSCSF